MKATFEFWAIDKDGNKWNEYISTKSSRPSKVRALISKKFNLDIEQCIDFGMRKTND